MKLNLKNILLGRTLKNDELGEEQMSRLWGLPIMSSDAVSSVAYAIEEMLIVLLPLGILAAFSYIPWIVISILALLLILIVSYSKIIDHFPNGGGAYSVSRESIGKTASLITASALIIDYIMTVAVSISSATAALSSAFPEIAGSKVGISVGLILLITLLNLRGIKEASFIFGLPTYVFIFSMGIMILVGFYKIFTGTLEPTDMQSDPIPKEVTEGFSLLFFFKAFSAGCSAMTGVEAVSNAVPSFKKPAARNAKHVLYLLGGIIIFIFGGTAILSGELQVTIVEGKTVLSQIAAAVFGNSFMFYIIQVFTSLILILAANTAYNGLPQLLSILAKDGYMPRYFKNRGAKLSYSNGIILIFFLSAILVVIFNADTHKLIPMYSVGVFLSFTFAQLGMFLKWRKDKEKGWQYKSLINGFGAVVTAVVCVIVFYNKFLTGAWIIAIFLPLIMATMWIIESHYKKVESKLTLEKFEPHYLSGLKRSTQCVLLVQEINKPFLKAINYATSVSDNINAVYISTNPKKAQALKDKWEELKIPYELVIIETPYRGIIEPLNEYITQREKELKSGESISVVISRLVQEHWYDFILHNNTTFFITNNLVKHKNVSAIVLPFHIK